MGFWSPNAALRGKAEWLAILEEHCGVGLWDAILHEGGAMHPASRWTWSAEFRRLCGFASEAEFPNVVRSWSDRLHPEDSDATFKAFGGSLATGLPYDVTYRLKVKDGSYRWFRATGGVIKDEHGVARRACGSLVDIDAERRGAADLAAAREALAGRFERELLGLVGDVAAAASKLEADAAAMSRATAQTSDRSASAAAASGEAAGNVRHVAAATEEFTASIREITQQVARSTQATSAADAGVGAATEAVRGLVADVRRIGDFVSIIGSVAGQTNLLALNATIEAARAGEAGRGFAVVAVEVKTLAAQTAKATEDISARIKAIQAATDGVESTIGGVAGTIAQLSGVAAAISAAVEQQSAVMAEIAGSIREASLRTGETSTGIGGVSQLAAEAGQVSLRIAESARSLAAQAGDVRAQVDVFLGGLRAA